MAGQNDFLIFDENKDNLLQQELYASDSDRTDGFKTGLARSNVNNKVLHQTSMMCHAIGEILKDMGLTASDLGSVELLKENLNLAFSTSGVLQQCYPVGSIYMSVNEVNPATLFGFGEWEQIKDKFILSAGDTYANGQEGGSAEVSLSTSQLPAHNHTASTNSTGAHTHSRGDMEIAGDFSGECPTGAGVFSVTTNTQASPAGIDQNNYFVTMRASRNWSGATSSNGSHTHTVTVNNTGLGEAHSNMPPYLAVNIWKRVA